MVNRIRSFCRTHRDLIIYLVFGVLTTAVSYLIYFPLLNLAGLSAAVSNALSWAGAVLFAFFTNKPFVFHSSDWSAGTVLRELGAFVGCRIASGAVETGILFLTVDFLHRNGNLWKILVSILVVILNYLASKLLVFRKGRSA